VTIQVFTNPDGSGTVYSLLNPITRSVVRFTEPFYFQTSEQYDGFAQAFNTYCDRAWAGDLRGDPLVVDPYKVWAGDESYVEEPARVLRDRLDELVAEFGIWAVAKTAMDYVDHHTIRLYLGDAT